MFRTARPRVIIPLIVLGTVVLALTIGSRLLYTPYRIPTGAMLPNLQPGDVLLARHLGPDDPVARGQILVFAYPRNRSVDYVKRCVAVAGDTVEVREGLLRVNGEIFESALDDPAADNSAVPGSVPSCPAPHTRHDPGGRQRSPVNERFGPAVVPAGHLFMMGDNRDDSLDSRYWGPLPRDLVKARAVVFAHPLRPARFGRQVR